MAYGRFVVTARVTVAAGTPSAVAQPGGTVTWVNGSGSSSKWAPPVPVTFLPGTVLYLDDTAPGATPTGPQQLYQAIGAGNLRAYVQGADDVDHVGISNLPSKLSGRWCPRARFPKLGFPQNADPCLWTTDMDYWPGNAAEVFFPHIQWISFPHFIAVYLWSGTPFHKPAPRLRTT
jgi:hypothetical protein